MVQKFKGRFKVQAKEEKLNLEGSEI